MHFSPEQFAEARALITRIVSPYARQVADQENMEQEIIAHLIELEDQYDKRPPGYWGRTVKNYLVSSNRREKARKRGAGRTVPLGEIHEEVIETPNQRPDLAGFQKAVRETPHEAAALARLLGSLTERETRKALGLSRKNAALLRCQLEEALQEFAPPAPKKRARPRADCVKKSKRPPKSEAP